MSVDPEVQAFLARTDAAVQAEPLTVALTLLNNTPGRPAGRGSTFIFRAVGDIEVTDSVELSTEPGVMGRIGPKFPRSASFRVRVHDNPKTKVDPKNGLFTPETARAQHNLLRNLVGTLMYIDARAAPPERIIWTIENVKAVDDNSAKNAYDVDVSAREILGGEFGEFIDPSELTTVQGLVPLAIDSASDPVVLGVGPVACGSGGTSVILASSVTKLSDAKRHQVLPAYVRSTHGSTYPLLPDWINFYRINSDGTNFIPGALATLGPADSQIVSVEIVARPDLSQQTYACFHLTAAAGTFTLVFDKCGTPTFNGLDVGVHLDNDSSHPPAISGTPPAPIILTDLLDPTLKMAIFFVGSPYNEEVVNDFHVGRTILIVRGNFT